MAKDDIELLAAEYVLGTLDSGSRQRVERRLSTDSRMLRLVETWQDKLAALAEHGPPVPVDPTVWRAIEARTHPPERPVMTTIRAPEGEWESIDTRIEKKRLHLDRSAAVETFLLRIAPGGRLPAHDHAALEECFVLEGEIRIGDMHLCAGDYHCALPGSHHPESRSDTGALVYLRAPLDEFVEGKNSARL